jgi:hypothetical protein
MMEPSEAKAERERLILRRKELLNGVHARRNSWLEFHQVCREILELDRRLEQSGLDGPPATVTRLIERGPKVKK